MLILPKAVAVIIISVLAVRELFRSSGAIFAFIVRGDTHDDSRRSFRLYCIKFAVLTVISLLISIADAALNYFSERHLSILKLFRRSKNWVFFSRIMKAQE